MPKPVLFLRSASVLTFVHAVLHTMNMVASKAEPGAQQTAVSSMKTNQFLVMGMTRSYWHFYLGFGFATSIFLLIESVAFWQLGSLAKYDAARLRPLIATFTAGYLALAVNSYTYFFAPPVITEVLIAALLIAAFLKAR